MSWAPSRHRHHNGWVPVRIKIALAALAVLMVALAIAAYNGAVTGSDQASSNKPDYINALVPSSGSQVLRQSEVGVDLRSGYDAYLVVDGVKITNNATEQDLDGLVRTPNLGRVRYTPAPGRRVERLESPRACVDAFVWRVIDGPTSAKQTQWCFGTT